jgi:hypothetical protein
MKPPKFTIGLFDCDDDSSLRLPSGSRFVRKLPDNRSLGYLHRFYSPLSAETDATLFRRLPDEYINFLQYANGAALFDNTVALYGHVETVTRSTEPETATAISISNENEVFSIVEPERWDQGWTKIGGLVGWDSSYAIQLNADGRCAIVINSLVVAALSFGECLEKIVKRLAPCFTCAGVADQSYVELEAALASLVYPN